MSKILANRQWLSQSVSSDLYHLSFVDSILVLYYKTAPGICFVAGVTENDLPKIAQETSQTILSREPKVMGTVRIGRIYFPHPPSKIHGIWPITEQDPEIAAFFAKAADRFLMMIDQYGRWDTFHHYLKIELNSDLCSPVPSIEHPADYWWLAGLLEGDGPFVPCSIYEEYGIYVDRAREVLPVFTSAVYAEMEAVRLSQSSGLKLIPQPIHCLGCFLTGFYNEEGKHVMRSVLLNNQWTIHGFTCNEQKAGGRPGCHFFLKDSDENCYALCGCAEQGTGPIWYAKSWDRNGTHFNPECRLVAW